MNLQTSKVFALNELWLLHRVIRHELPGQEQMKFPYYNLDLNDQIVETILRCEELNLREAALILTRGDCLAIDAMVNVDMKDQYGKPLGKDILLKVFAARRDLAGGPVATADESEVPTDFDAKLEEWKTKRRTRGKRSA